MLILRLVRRAGFLAPWLGVAVACADSAGPELALEIPTAIAFDSDRTGNRDIFVIWPDGRLTQVTDHPAFDGSPDWSPDAQKFAFYTRRDGAAEIYVSDVDGSNPLNLTNDPNSDAHPDWSPDGTKIAFHSDRDGSWDIWVMNADGSEPVDLTDALPGDQGYAAWSPDGTRIAFHSIESSGTNIFIMNADGSEPRQITRTGAFDGRPAWSPDGSLIAFESNLTGGFDIYVMNADGTDVRVVTEDPVLEASPNWSPDGSWIAYSWLQTPKDAEVFLVRPDGSGKTNLTRHVAYDAWPDWRPVP